MSVLIAQMTDLHIADPGYLTAGRVDTAAMLVTAVAHLNALDPQPDLILLTGDLVDAGSASQYERLRSLLAPLAAPINLLPGNHDDRDAMRHTFPQLPAGDRVTQVIDVGGLRLILLDDVIPGSPCGELGDEQRAWLDRKLSEEPDRPTLVALHHPPFPTGIAHMDTMGLNDADLFGAVIERHPHVAGVIAGHLHRPITTKWRGTIAMTAPSVAHQVALDLGPIGPARYVLEPPAVLLHRWTEEVGVVTHVSYVGDFGGPRGFDDGPPT